MPQHGDRRDAGALLGCLNLRHDELCPGRTYWGAPVAEVLLRTWQDAQPTASGSGTGVQARQRCRWVGFLHWG